ncbi:hypothetical protein LOTGIDRAFT_126696 [Lottia gigantea]|uniref:PNK FHA domain-containing protein n=1 Tax=Lottia gigantea TaxID=225164 RepID=V4BHH6_LOTGI|nr:hypothetical protein LOTGIDRAFT_126696 [Lottia gigantea]ESO88114.1 hypothetical protein LOTGIDRAFT_126696 [Lottia gigantea]
MTSRSRGLKRSAKDATALKAKKAKGETDLCNGLHWIQHGKEVKGASPVIALVSDSLPGRNKVAGFDIDFTIIKTKSGRKFATGSKDWEFWDDSVPKKLQSLDKDGYRVVFFTNQAGIEKMKVKPEEIKDKIEAIIAALNIPVLAFICTGENHFRKPSPLMWDFMANDCNQSVKLDLTKCVYVGDAAGRAKNWAPGKPKDFSCGDRMFAQNIGIEFHTPDEFFLGEKPAKFDWGSLNAVDYLKTNPICTEKKVYKGKGQEVVIMVGCPASGKSTFRKRHFEPHGYVAVNRDTMGTQEKCIKAAKEALKKGKSVVADNTNPSVSARQPYVEMAESKGIPCRCFYMQTPREVSNHLNYMRQTQTYSEVRRIPDVGFNVYKKNFEEPTKAEGFTEIINIDFKPMFDNKRDEELFKLWT